MCIVLSDVLTVGEAVEGITSSPRFDIILLKHAKMACYLIHILCHATGVMSFVILLPSYLNASHGATTAGKSETESEMRQD